VKEQSHKDEMSAALRGDFQRLRERGVAVSLVPTDAEPVADTTPHEEEPAERALPLLATDVPAEAPEPPPEPRPEPPPEPPPEPTPEPHETQDEPAASQPGWLGRLLGR
jgi:hypothetical protein